MYHVIDAQFDLGLRYYNSNGVAQNHAKAIEWYSKAAKQEHAGALNNLGVLKANGYPVEFIHIGSKVLFGSKEFYEKACQLGNQKGCDNYKSYRGW
ncbi:tetratricopeptide repeat protein [Ursidibacter arcticus]|uniref:tetratricopeptide repeat protein n=1 Tax=Ursidibacter arcticus TaxID=1524965 RepID=UPI0013C3439B